MFRSYFIIGWRNLLKSRTHSFINIGGLTVGIASCLLIGLYIADEVAYDRQHDKADRIVRVVAEDWAKTPPALGPALISHYPHLLDQAVRLWPLFSPAKMRHKEAVFVESGGVFADPNVFSVFSWPFIAGNPAKALIGKNSIVLTQAMATKYFGEKDPLGQQLKFWGNELTVTGVIGNIRHNSHLQFDFLISISTLQSVMGNDLNETWDMPVFYTYVLRNSGVTSNQLANAIRQLIQANSSGSQATIALQPIRSIHLHSDLKGEFKAGGNISYLYILGTAALFILTLASINFTNFNTVRATTRSKEVGMRKTLGAMKRELIEQFFGEALMTSVISLVIAIAIVTVALPAFNQFSGKAIQVRDVMTPQFLGSCMVVVLLISFCAGSYPAIFLSRLKPVSSLKGSVGIGTFNVLVRKGLIVFQFMVSTFFLMGMVIVLLQLDYLQDKDLGFDRDQIIVLDGDGFPLLRKELQGVAGVEQVAAVPQVLPTLLPSSPYQAEGIATDSSSQMRYYGVTAGFIATMGIKLIAGEGFKEGSREDTEQAFILNESAVRELGWSPEEAIGKSFSMSAPPIDGAEVGRNGHIIGVVENFNHDVLYKKVSPIVLYPSNDINLTFVRIAKEADAIPSIEKVWRKVNPDAPFNYYFLDDRIRKQYESEMKLGTLMTAATVLAVIIACLGLSGLVAFSANQRTKEIGIRKVMGASSRQVVALLSCDFIKLVGLAALLSLPIAYYALSAWIANFAYHIGLSWLIFVAGGLCTVGVALVTIILQSLNTALAQPAESLRSE